jgi:signal transduction histidine kinase
VSLALSSETELDAEARERAAREIGEALGDLRTAVQRPMRPPPARPTATLADELGRLARDHPESLIVADGDVEVPEELEGIAQATLGEAVRNAHRHATPTRIEVRAGLSGDAFELEIVNDGVREGTRRTAGSAMGLRLLAFEALEYGGIVEFGPRDDGRWHVRLVVPEAGAA